MMISSNHDIWQNRNHSNSNANNKESVRLSMNKIMCTTTTTTTMPAHRHHKKLQLLDILKEANSCMSSSLSSSTTSCYSQLQSSFSSSSFSTLDLDDRNNVNCNNNNMKRVINEEDTINSTLWNKRKKQWQENDEKGSTDDASCYNNNTTTNNKYDGYNSKRQMTQIPQQQMQQQMQQQQHNEDEYSLHTLGEDNYDDLLVPMESRITNYSICGSVDDANTHLKDWDPKNDNDYLLCTKKNPKKTVSFYHKLVSFVYILDRPQYESDYVNDDGGNNTNIDVYNIDDIILKTVFDDIDCVDQQHHLSVNDANDDDNQQQQKQQHDEEKLSLWYSRYELDQIKKDIRRMWCYYNHHKTKCIRHCSNSQIVIDSCITKNKSCNNINIEEEVEDKQQLGSTTSLFQESYTKCCSTLYNPNMINQENDSKDNNIDDKVNNLHYDVDTTTTSTNTNDNHSTSSHNYNDNNYHNSNMLCHIISKELSNSTIYYNQRGIERFMNVDYNYTRQFNILLSQSNVFIEQSNKFHTTTQQEQSSPQQQPIHSSLFSLPNHYHDETQLIDHNSQQLIANVYHTACRSSALYAHVIGLADYYVAYESSPQQH